MRLLVVLISLGLLTTPWGEASSPVPDSQASPQAVALYDTNRAHIWNRLHESLLVREGPTGIHYGVDSLDPLLWLNSKHLLVQPSHRSALRVLDEFLHTHAENLIHDPVKRAILQRDLWAVFDWSVQRQPEHLGEAQYEEEKRELQIRLAEALRRLALTSKQIEALPDNYAQAVASGEFGKEYQPEHRDRPFLPPDLFDGRGPWVEIEAPGEIEPVAATHVYAVSGRSRFLVFIRLPQGRKATLDYFRTLWDFPEPWIVRADEPKQAEVNPNLPSFPAGTEVALVRQMTLFDNQGQLVPAPITESVQIRVYRTVTRKEDVDSISSLDDATARSEQDFYEIRLSRQQLFAHQAGGLRAVGREEREFFTFQAQGDDLIEDSVRFPPSKYPPVVQTCAECHRGAGINSLNSRASLLKPKSRQLEAEEGVDSPRWWENDGTTDWKQQRYDWGLLNGYWRGKPDSNR
ncbi:MAG: hypothetical protein WB952_11650 [Terriglobales bacterium]